MSTEKTTNEIIAARLSALVDEISGGNGALFAKTAGINQATLHNYLNGRLPSSEALINICNRYSVNINWLLTGNGPIYIYGDGGVQQPEPDPEIADLIEGARRVLKSGNAVAFDALERNIRYFDFAIQQEKDMAEQKRKLSEMEKRLVALEEKKNCKTPGEGEPLSRKKAV